MANVYSINLTWYDEEGNRHDEVPQIRNRGEIIAAQNKLLNESGVPGVVGPKGYAIQVSFIGEDGFGSGPPAGPPV